MAYSKEYLEMSMGVEDLRKIVRELGDTPGLKSKSALIDNILKIQSGEIKPIHSGKGRKPRQFDRSRQNAQADGEAVLSGETSHDTVYKKDYTGDCENFPSLKCDDDTEAARKTIDLQPAPPTENVKGILEFHVDGYAFMRGENYEADPSSDVYVSKNTIRSNRLRRGDYVEGVAERTRDNSSPCLKTITNLNGKKFNPYLLRPFFDDLIPCYPDERITLERKDDESDLSIRAIDLLCPIGKGQRGLIVAPPKAGKTTLLKKIAKSIEINHPDVKMIVLLIDERPEEVTDLKRSVKGEVIYSTFDETPDHHIRAAELVLNRSKRLVESGEDVVILLDSITKLTRAYNAVVPSSGKTLSGGIDPIALQAPKKFFGAARNIEKGGSLTILSTALIETGSKMDDVIYEEFKGTGNMEIILSRTLSERRIFPAIDLYRSGTRKDELLLSEQEFECAYAVRRYLDRDDNASQNLLDMLKRTENNEEFVKKAPVWCKMMTDNPKN